MRKLAAAVLALLASTTVFAQGRVRCTAADQSYSYIRAAPCPVATDIQTPVTTSQPLMQRSPATTGPVRCTSRDGKRVTIEKGNCASPDAYQQRLGE